MNLFPYDTKFDFMALRRYALVVSLALLVAAVVGMATRGLNYALDFTGGTAVELKFEKPVDAEAIRQKLAAAGIENPNVQSLGATNELIVRLKSEKGADGEHANADKTGAEVLAVVNSADNPARVLRGDFVGPQVGKELAQQGLVAVLFVALGFLIYISVRFEKRFAAAAILTTMHDVVVVIGYFAVTGKEFDLNVFAGVLSVMGYSINDTIVVFDRVRENFRNMHRATPYEVLNKSVGQTLSRTVITSFVALLTVLALYFFGGDALKSMAESQIIGIVIGTLSSIFFACPLLLWFGATRKDLLPRAKDLSYLERRP
ncbi:protein translocase subunit SecF [Ahniella affigens]|uniref:Protein-export membrane protein SecF n=1 Tax=Ahniella affigens TaxID=2021234 RepID=A0A2P1PLN7_9GAMM|nr:protein translocase subunit SecF [Ahniella affigens]AVP95746.1 protein translocase subunit SecF [Ahniella affigens]